MNVQTFWNDVKKGHIFFIKKFWLSAKHFLAKRQSDKVPDSENLKQNAATAFNDLVSLEKPQFDMNYLYGSWAISAIAIFLLFNITKSGKKVNDLTKPDTQNVNLVNGKVTKELTLDEKEIRRNKVKKIINSLEEKTKELTLADQKDKKDSKGIGQKPLLLSELTEIRNAATLELVGNIYFTTEVADKDYLKSISVDSINFSTRDGNLYLTGKGEIDTNAVAGEQGKYYLKEKIRVYDVNGNLIPDQLYTTYFNGDSSLYEIKFNSYLTALKVDKIIFSTTKKVKPNFSLTTNEPSGNGKLLETNPNNHGIKVKNIVSSAPLDPDSTASAVRKAADESAAAVRRAAENASAKIR